MRPLLRGRGRTCQGTPSTRPTLDREVCELPFALLLSLGFFGFSCFGLADGVHGGDVVIGAAVLLDVDDRDVEVLADEVVSVEALAVRQPPTDHRLHPLARLRAGPELVAHVRVYLAFLVA